MHFVESKPKAAEVDACATIDARVQRSPWSRAQFQDSFDRDAYCLVFDGDRVCAYCIWRTVLDEAELLTIAVDANFQQQGLAKQLLAHMFHILREKNIRHVFLEVAKSNEVAICLYQHVGFEVVGERADYYRVGDLFESAYVMSCTL